MTVNEQKALDLARRVFEHFTRESLSLAQEIIALEQTMQSSGDHNQWPASIGADEVPVDQSDRMDLSAHEHHEHRNENHITPVNTEVICENPYPDIPF